MEEFGHQAAVNAANDTAEARRQVQQGHKILRAELRVLPGLNDHDSIANDVNKGL